jgi:hypothetical protein
MKTLKKTLTLAALVSVSPLCSLTAQTSEILETGMFDTGRLRTNGAVDFHAFNQWNGPTDNDGNVGWNGEGIWWAFARFGSGASQHTNPELFNKLAAADKIYLQASTLRVELDPALVGVVQPGVVVSVYLVPGFDIPEGSLPTWNNAWPFSYPEQIKMFEIDPATTPRFADSAGEFNLNHPDDEARIENLQRYDITDAIKGAIEQGLLTDATPWGIVYFTDEGLPLTPNDPKWADKRQTVMDNKFQRLELVTGETGGETWADYPVDAEGYVNTEGFLGWLNVASGDWIWSYSLDGYIYLPESNVGESGGWAYVPK